MQKFGRKNWKGLVIIIARLATLPLTVPLAQKTWKIMTGASYQAAAVVIDTLQVQKITLGVKPGITCYKHTVKGGNWQAARTMGAYSLVGCTVAPGFDFSDFKFMKDEAALCTVVLKNDPDLSVFI